MSRKTRKPVSILLAIAMIATLFLSPTTLSSVRAAAEAKLTVSSTSALPGSTVTVDVSIADNPGILGATLKLEYDEGLTLTDGVNGSAFGALVMTKPGQFVSGCKFMWDGQDLSADQIKDGTILTLTFNIAEDAADGTEYNVKVTCEDAADKDLNPVNVTVTNGKVGVLSYKPGDVNGDDKVNSTDVILMRRFIAGGYNVTINENAANVNGDTKVNSTDVILLRRFIAGGYGVELVGPKVTGHTHTMQTIAKVDPTCTEDGNIAYYKCTSCGKLYTDANGVNEIHESDTVIAATGHIAVTDPGVPATTTSTGLTEGSHCGVCGITLVAQEEIPKLESHDQYSVIYHIYEDDTYLKSLNIENPNPAYYTSEEGLTLRNLKVDGYIFEGWYDGEGQSAQKVTKIETGTTGEVDLYAHWTPRVYTITFDSPLAPMNEISYTVNKGATLVNPDWFGYTFMAWTNDEEDGSVVTRIPKGTIGNMTLTANWTSKRNQTVSTPAADPMMIYEDEENGQYLFVYEIGRIENVPLYLMKDLGNRAGIDVSETVTTSNSVSRDTANTVVNTIANATTKTNAFTLSKDWNSCSTIIQSHTDENGTEVVDSSTSMSENSSVHVTSSDEGGSYGQELKNKQGISAKVGVKTYAETGIDSALIGTAKAGLEVNVEGSMSGEASYGKNETATWGSTESDTTSSRSSSSSTNTRAISKKVSDTYGYNQSYSNGGSEQSVTSESSSSSEQNEYSNTFAYSDAQTETTSKTYSNANAPEGYYRLMCAGIVNVFAVVGYDIANSDYYVYTFSVQNDRTYDFIDYSKDSPSFNDYENGVLPFEIPFSVDEYVRQQMKETDGLIVDKNTGHITGYNGTDTDVIIPDYITMPSVNDTPEVVQIKGFDEGAFKNNTNITSVTMGKYITEFPASVFEGCTSLTKVEAPSITSIGKKAFYGCTALDTFKMSAGIESLGTQAFTGAQRIEVTPKNADVTKNAARSGAHEIILNLNGAAAELAGQKLEVPESVDYIELNGEKATFENFVLNSKAGTTVINKMNITSDGEVPIEISSGIIKISSSEFTAPGWVMKLSADSIDMTLDGTVAVTSGSENAILTKSITLAQMFEKSKAKMDVTGNIYVCDTIDAADLLNNLSGEVIIIDEDSYDSLYTDSLEWIKASEAPAGAKILARKWTYDETINTTSSSSTLPGYTLYDTTYAWSSYGSWSSWSRTAVSGSESRQVETKNVSNNDGYTWNVYYYWKSKSALQFSYYNEWGANGVYYELGQKPTDQPQMKVYGSYGGLTTYRLNDNNGGRGAYFDAEVWWLKESKQIPATTHVEYRYRDRTKIYTYYFTKKESKESETEVTPSSTISNVVEWVKCVNP